jgi:hypothetical protein
MKWKQWIEKWGLTGLSINAGFLGLEWQPQDADRAAAWELYIELLTRITTQDLAPDDGDEQTALASIHSLFPISRETIKRHGRFATEFTKIAIVVLNQLVRPFTAKWHRLSLQKAFEDPARCAEFRQELATLQSKLRIYTKMLSDMAGVEDLTNLQSSGE